MSIVQEPHNPAGKSLFFICLHSLSLLSLLVAHRISNCDRQQLEQMCLKNLDHRGLEDVPDPSSGDREPYYICLTEEGEAQVWTVFGRRSGSLSWSDYKPSSYLSLCFSLVGANFFPVPSVSYGF